MSIKFLLNVASIFQSEEPFIHCVFGEIKDVLVSLQKCFMKPINFEWKTTKELMKTDAPGLKNHLEMRNIDLGIEVKQQVFWSL